MSLLQARRTTAEELLRNYLARVQRMLTEIDQLPVMQDVQSPQVREASAQFLKLHPEFVNLVVLDRSGNLLFSALHLAAGSPQSFAKTPPTSELLGARGFTVSNAFRGINTGRWSCAVAIPMKSRPDALLIVAIDIRKLSDELFLAPDDPKLIVTVGDRKNTIVLSSLTPATRIGQTRPTAGAVERDLAAGQSAGEFVDVKGVTRAYSAGRIEPSGWIVVAAMPTEEIFRDAWGNVQRALGAIALGILLSVLLVTYYARGIARPVAALAVAARAQTEGRSEILAPVAGPDEIAATAEVFNEMVAARTQAEKVIRAREARLRAIIEAEPECVKVVGVDGRLQEMNAAGLAMIEVDSLEAVRGLPVAELITPEYREAFADLHARVLRGESVMLEFVIKGLRGRNRWMDTHAVPLRDDRGVIIGQLAITRDITARRTAEAAMREMTVLQTTILDSASSLIVACDRDGIIRIFNRAAERLLGYQASEVVGRATPEIFHDAVEVAARARQYSAELGEPVSPGMATFLARSLRGRPNEDEWIFIRKDGSRLSVLLSVTLMHGPDGAVTGSMGIGVDLTERKKEETARLRIEKKIQETQKLESLGVLAGGIAHDFNNLLTGVLGHASLAKLELPAGAAAQQSIQQIEVAARRAADLCRQMLAYSGKGHFVVQRLDLNQIVEEGMHLLQISISKQCVLRTQLTRPLPAIVADATQVRQIIMNLVINASEAIGARSGVIALTTGVVRADQQYLQSLRFTPDLPSGDYVYIEISDNGGGMDEATLAQIFDPFFTTKFTGRGLGLAAVLGIMRGHRGGVKVYSEPGRGTTFKVLFPGVTGAAEDTEKQFASQLTWRGRGTVLVVDDEETVRAVGGRMLESLGFEVVLAEHGRDGLEKFQAEPDRYALVLLDLTMPHMDGQETFRHLRALRPAVKILLMSGFNQQEAISPFAGKGLAGFVQKPFELETLALEIRHVLERSVGSG